MRHATGIDKGDACLMNVRKQWLTRLDRSGKLDLAGFDRREVPLSELRGGEVCVRTQMVSIDPASRFILERVARDAWTSSIGVPPVAMLPPCFAAQVQPGEVMPALAIGEIIESRFDSLRPGDIVEGSLGWQDFSILPGESVVKRDRALPSIDLLGVQGLAGLTAYHALCNRAPSGPGRTVVISGASGGIGSIAGQIAKTMGCRTIGLVGNAAKAEWIISEVGFDAAIDYSAGSFTNELRKLCPDEIDIFLDLVGGSVLDGVLPVMGQNARVVSCGFTSNYSHEDYRGIRFSNLWLGIEIPQLELTGANVTALLNDASALARAKADLDRWVGNGDLKTFSDVSEGFEAIPEAFAKVLSGQAQGKVMVRL